MTDLFIQFDALAQGPNVDDWVEILFIGIMVIIWLAGGLIKAIGSKRPQQQRQREGLAQERRRQGETWQQRLARKAEEMQRAAEARTRQAAERMQRMEEQARARAQGEQQQPRPARQPGGRVTVRSGPRGESVMVYEQSQEQAAPEHHRQTTPQREAAEAVAAARRYTPRPALPVEAQIDTRAPGSEPLAEPLTGVMREPPKPLDLGIERPGIPRESAGFTPGEVIDDYRDPEALKKAILHYEILGKPLALRERSEGTSIF